MVTYLLSDDIYLRHDTGFHPENADRLRRTISYLQKQGLWDRLVHLAPRKATVEEVTYVHHPRYIKSVKEAVEEGIGYLDMDTVLSPESYEVALYAVGGVFNAIDAVMTEKGGNALCLVRPPGHHATPTRGMGFCLFNNVALGVRYVQKQHQLRKIAIIDWDLHHGNGTQEAFYDDDSVLYFSLHRYPYYPGTGASEETGTGQGKGFTINLPLGGEIHRSEYLRQFNQVLDTRIKSFAPELIFISAGFDTYENDPLGGLGLKVEDYTALTTKVKLLAEASCAGRIVSVLEGGYSLEGIPLCIEAHLKGLLSH